MAAPLALLDYAGPQPTPPRTFVGRCWRAIDWLITMTILIVFVTVRGVLLGSGFVLMFAGLVLLTLGGKRSAARKLMDWRERFVDLSRLWLCDITRTLRRGHRRERAPIPVVSVTPQ